MRPDLLAASDHGFDALGRRATTPPSLGRCLVRSDVGMLVVADALAVSSPASAAEIDELLGTGDVDAVLDALDRLQRRGVVVVENGVAAPVAGLDDLLHRPLGLGRSIAELWDHLSPPVAADLVELLAVGGAHRPSTTARAVACRMREPDGLARLLDGAPDNTEAIIDALVEQRSPAIGLPAGHLYRDVDRYDPLTWMLGRGLIVPVNDGLAELPREVVIARSPQGLAPGAVLRPIGVQPVAGLGVDQVSAAAADQAARALEACEALLRLAVGGEISVRKAGGVGVRELRRLGKLLALEPRDAGRLLELLHAARLVAASPGAVTETPLAGAWWGQSRARRWLVLVRAWLASPSFLSRALSTDEAGDPVPALGGDDPVAAAHAGRRVMLEAITTVGGGSAHDPDQLTEAVVWRSPNLWGTGDPPPEVLVEWSLAEAALLGLTALDAAAPVLDALVSEDDEAVNRLATAALGDDQGQFVLQSDLTAVGLGPLDPAVAGDLGELADRVAGLSVPTYRFSEASLRRGFDRGWTAEGVESFLVEHAMSGLPQPLSYLIADVDRRYGSVRVLGATSVVVADDEASAVELAATARAARLGLRLVAPTVLVGPVDPHRMVEELRAEGLFPTLDGSTIGLSAGVGRRRSRSEGTGNADKTVGSDVAEGGIDLPPDWTGPPLVEAALSGEVAEAVEALLATDEAPVAGSATDARFDLDRRLARLWNRPAVVMHLSNGELVEVRGVLVDIDDTLTLLGDGGLEEVAVESVVSVEDPAR